MHIGGWRAGRQWLAAAAAAGGACCHGLQGVRQLWQRVRSYFQLHTLANDVRQHRKSNGFSRGTLGPDHLRVNTKSSEG